MSELFVLMYVDVTLQTRSPVSLEYGCRLKLSLDSNVDVTPLSSDWTISWSPSLVYVLDEPEYSQVTTPGAPTVVHFRTILGVAVLVMSIVGTTAH